MATENKGWTIFGHVYHRVWWVGPSFGFGRKCDNGWVDQTTVTGRGKATGALVPEDLRPCKRCFPNGDA